MKLGEPIPALPVADAGAASEFYRDRLGFDIAHHDDGFAIVVRDEATVHLWQAADHDWRDRDDLDKPVQTGTESFLAGTASCRIHCEGIDELYAELADARVLHKVSFDGVDDTDWGTREFHVVDLDGNLITFFERV
jgi:catechol 2,3-dioxygenase-like lactoylglutathione lyase family enzyme